jgi:hypothetical protein
MFPGQVVKPVQPPYKTILTNPGTPSNRNLQFRSERRAALFRLDFLVLFYQEKRT